jgi:uncharacterized membrane protein
MMDEQSPIPQKRVYRWPWFVLAGVVLFFIASIMWLLVFVQRVQRMKASTIEMTNSGASSVPAKR